MGRAPRMDVAAEDELRSRIGTQPALELGPIHEIAGIRKPGGGQPGRLGQQREVRRDDDDVRLVPAGRRAGRRTAAARDRGRRPTPARQPVQGGSSCEQPDPVPAGRRRTPRRGAGRGCRSTVASGATLGCCRAERRRATRSLGFANCTKSPSRRIRSTRASENHSSAASVRSVEVLGLEDVDPARARRLQLAVEIAEDADAHYGRSSSSASAAASIVCSRQPGAKGDCCSW